jgi:hypothetical protein
MLRHWPQQRWLFTLAVTVVPQMQPLFAQEVPQRGASITVLPTLVADYSKQWQQVIDTMRTRAQYGRRGGPTANVYLIHGIVLPKDTAGQREILRELLQTAVQDFRTSIGGKASVSPDLAARFFRVTGPGGHSVTGVKSYGSVETPVGRDLTEVYVLATGAGLLQVRTSYTVAADSDAVRRRVQLLASGLAVALDLQR